MTRAFFLFTHLFSNSFFASNYNFNYIGVWNNSKNYENNHERRVQVKIKELSYTPLHFMPCHWNCWSLSWRRPLSYRNQSSVMKGLSVLRGTNKLYTLCLNRLQQISPMWYISQGNNTSIVLLSSWILWCVYGLTFWRYILCTKDV